MNRLLKHINACESGFLLIKQDSVPLFVGITFLRSEHRIPLSRQLSLIQQKSAKQGSFLLRFTGEAYENDNTVLKPIT
jgi:hypothetical protein